MRREILEETDNTAKGNVSRRRNRPNGKTCPLGPSFNHSPEERKKDKSVANTVASVQYKEKESTND